MDLCDVHGLSRGNGYIASWNGYWISYTTQGETRQGQYGTPV